MHTPQAISNFSGGPGALAPIVLQKASQALLALPETGISVLGMSHRSDWFRQLLDQAENNIRTLLDVPSHYHVLFLQGGGSLQFNMIAMNFARGQGTRADYLQTGYWSAKAVDAVRAQTQVHLAWNGANSGYARLPKSEEMSWSARPSYVHYVDNETVEGLEFNRVAGLVDAPLMCDMSSNLMSRPVDVSAYDLIYAHAQKNLGPAGVTVVIVKDDLVQTANAGLPAVLDYRTHIKARSIYNTPPVFAIYVLKEVTQWLLDDVGGLEKMAAINQQKSQLLYRTLDELADFYRLHAQREDRSRMNCTFDLVNQKLLKQWLMQAQDQQLWGLEGHRSLGGIRASLYNAVSLQDVQKLSQFLKNFAQENA